MNVSYVKRAYDFDSNHEAVLDPIVMQIPPIMNQGKCRQCVLVPETERSLSSRLMQIPLSLSMPDAMFAAEPRIHTRKVKPTSCPFFSAEPRWPAKPVVNSSTSARRAPNLGRILHIRPVPGRQGPVGSARSAVG